MDQFSRTKKILSESDFNLISNLKVLIVGVGGVGGYALEALVRIGVNNITIVDNDTIDITNLNRQIIALNSNIGESKVEVAKKRVLDINPNINITTINSFITKDNIDTLFNKKYDYIVDACDTITTKLELIKKAKELNIKIISSMGTGNKFDPTKLVIGDISKTSYDPLSKVMRKLLKDNHINKLMVVSSTEKPIKTDRTPGSTSLVPSVAGIYCATYIINDTLKKPNN